MNPDPIVVEAIGAIRESDRRKREAQRAQSRAAQPRRKDNRKLVRR